MSTYTWSTMSPRERDALVAKEVMGWTGVEYYSEIDDHPLSDCVNGFSPQGTCMAIPFYTTSIAAAWEVVENMQSNKWDMHLSVNCRGEWEAWFYHQPTRNESLEYAPTAPEAICLAALRAVGVDI